MIDACADHLLILDGKGNVEIFHGSYTEYHQFKDRQRQDAHDKAEHDRKQREAQQKRLKKQHAQSNGSTAKNAKNGSGGGKGRAKPSRSKSSADALERLSDASLESKIEQLETRIKEIDASLADPDVWSDPKKCEKLGDDRIKAAQELEPLEFEWMRRAEAG